MTLRIVLLVVLFFNAKAFGVKVVEIGVASNFSELSTVTFNPFTGHFKDGVSLALRIRKSELERRGINIKLREFDYGTSDLKVISQVKEAIDSDVLAVIGYNYSSSALIAAPLHKKARLPMVSPSASANRLGTFGRYVHLGSFSNDYMASSLAGIAAKALKAKRALIIPAVNCAYCVDLSESFEREFIKNGGVVAKKINILQEEKDFRSSFKDIKSIDFDVVFVPNQEVTSARIISSLVHLGVNKPFLGADGWGNEGKEFFNVLKGKSFTGFSITHWHPSLDSEKSRSFSKKYLQYFSRVPNDTSVLAFDSMNFLIDGILRAKELSRESLEVSLSETKEFNGVTGKFIYEKNKAPEKDLIILKTSGGGFVIDRTVPPLKKSKYE